MKGDPNTCSRQEAQREREREREREEEEEEEEEEEGNHLGGASPLIY